MVTYKLFFVNKKVKIFNKFSLFLYLSQKMIVLFFS
uniref:Uncharacterized protein n=1 Tax=Siphoviridae sp. ctHip2 TaxID=2827830 RepID=A0A8S5RWH7_9CAUD|nr:MAG TPA: hypothetical protein [Siphoviridae sp. ctHip2]